MVPRAQGSWDLRLAQRNDRRICSSNSLTRSERIDDWPLHRLIDFVCQMTFGARILMPRLGAHSVQTRRDSQAIFMARLGLSVCGVNHG
jgi:hypothetical protein